MVTASDTDLTQMPLEGMAQDTGRLPSMPPPGAPIDLNPEQRAALGKRLATFWTQCGNAPQINRKSDGTRNLDTDTGFDWDEYLCRVEDPPSDFPISGPNGEPMTIRLNMPLTHYVVNALIAQWMQTDYQNEGKLASAFASDNKSIERADECARYLNFTLRHNVKYIKSQRLLRERTAVEGVGIRYWRWETKRRRKVERVNGKPRRVKDVTEYDGPVCSVIPRKDFRMWPASSETPEDAEWCFVRNDISLAELKAGREGDDPRFVMEDEDFEKVWKAGGSSSSFGPNDGNDLTGSRIVAAVDGYGVYENDGTVTDVKVTFLPDFGMCISATPTLMGSRKPFVLHYAYSHGDDPWGKSVPQIIRGINAAYHQFYNQLLNEATAAFLMSNTWFGSVDQSFTFRLGGFNAVRAGDGAITQGRYTLSQPSFDILKQLQQELQRATGLNDNMFGMYAPSAITATQTRAALGAGGMQFEQTARLFSESQVTDFETLSELIRLYAPETIEFATEATDAEIDEHDRAEADRVADANQTIARQLGATDSDLAEWNASTKKSRKPAPRIVKRTLKASDFDGLYWAVTGIMAGIDEQSRIQKAQLMISSLLGNPAAAALVQNHPDRVWEILALVPRAAGYDHIERFIGLKPDKDAEPEQPQPTQPKAPPQMPQQMPEGMPQTPEGMPQMPPQMPEGMPEGMPPSPVQAAEGPNADMNPAVLAQLLRTAQTGEPTPGVVE